MIEPATTYVLPLKWDREQHRAEIADLTAYLSRLSCLARVVVVDGSSPDLFRRHHDLWSASALHVPPDPMPVLNGKVAGVHTGMRLASTEAVVIADDDVRYDEESLSRTVALLTDADLVGPQNVLRPLPWHATWDSARSLLNRAFAADYPGTFAVRRITFEAMGGYDGNVLFENLELMRTVRAHGGTVLRPRGVYVVRRPPTVERFLAQRVRQAFDDVAQPWRPAVFLPVLPAVLSGRRGRRAVLAGLLCSVLLAEVGRRRDDGTRWFPARTSLLAPAWVAERSICSWIALSQRIALGGVRYAGTRLSVAAHSNRQLRRLAATRRSLVSPSGPETGPVGPVAEGLERRTPASTEGDGRPTGVDRFTVDANDAEVPPDDERTVGIGRHDDVLAVASHLHVVRRHALHAAPSGVPQTNSGAAAEREA